MPRHTTVQNVEYWKDQTESWFGKEVHGKPFPEFTGIAGQVVIDFPDSWNQSEIQHVRSCLITHNFPEPKVRDSRLRIDASDKRLSGGFK